jgi:hypothetical protein
MNYSTYCTCDARLHKTISCSSREEANNNLSDSISLSHHLSQKSPSTMKISLSLLFASLASTSAFVVQPPSFTRASVKVFDSRKRQKIASRTKWVESRGGAAEASAAEGTATSSAGLMTNEHGLKYVKLVHPDTGATSEVYLYGGVVTSYVDGDGTEVSASNVSRSEYCKMETVF